jgi:iron(II)-dependent oxidoreductase
MKRDLPEKIAGQLTSAREQTMKLFELCEEKHLRESPGFGFRPILWHLAHIGAFEEFWLQQKIKGAKPLNEMYQRIFDPIKTPRESSKNLPSKAEMTGYLKTVRDRTFQLLEKIDFDERNPLLKNGYGFDLVWQHELQHQETLAYLFHLLSLEVFQSPPAVEISNAVQAFSPNFVEIPAGEFEVGCVWADSFCYDNELPVHKLFGPDFAIARFLTTNAEFAEFMAEGGYENKEFWSDDGWEFREKENLTAPLYWRRVDNEWLIRTMFEEKTLAQMAAHPVYGVSFYEAEAYARFRGMRLPTEFEWEKAASWNNQTQTKQRFAFGDAEPNTENCNFGFNFWNTAPIAYFTDNGVVSGGSDLTGNVWEWTDSTFIGYPDFSPFPYPEYSQEWFDGDHKVLKGGSWATSPPILRTSFRNFFRRRFRIAFAGIRLVKDV